MTPEERMAFYSMKKQPEQRTKHKRLVIPWDGFMCNAPLIPKSKIPEGYVQTWDVFEKRYLIVPKLLGDKAYDKIGTYQTNPEIDMSEDNSVEVAVETTETPNEAPEAVEAPTEASQEAEAPTE